MKNKILKREPWTSSFQETKKRDNGLLKWPDSYDSLSKPNPINCVVNKYKYHPSVQKITWKHITVKPFSFQPVTLKHVFDVISALVDTKTSGGDIL